MLLKLLLSLLTFFNSHRRHDVPVGPISDSDILEAHTALHGDHYGGDMMFHEDVSDAGINNTQYRWPGYPGKGTVAYVIDYSMAPHYNLILKAMDQYHKLTCIKFVPRKKAKNYILIKKGNGGCSSYVGNLQRGRQPVNLGRGCEYVGTIVHELGHAIGLYHEHQRSDRDKYVTIYKGNVTNGEFHNFDKTDKSSELIYTTYDYSSIMHYGNYAFSKSFNKLMTMEAKNGQELIEPYDKPGLTDRDVDMIKKLYKCK